jgi:hypothetical protein
MKELEDILDLNLMCFFAMKQVCYGIGWTINYNYLVEKMNVKWNQFYNNGVICASREMGGFSLQGRSGPPFLRL